MMILTFLINLEVPMDNPNLTGLYGSKVILTMKSGARYLGLLGGLQQATGRLHLHDLEILSYTGGIIKHGGYSESRWFHLSSVKSVEGCLIHLA